MHSIGFCNSHIIVVFLINVMKVISTVARVLQQPYIKSNAGY